jgi:FlaG/FlaF family flagellin (archaellin)
VSPVVGVAILVGITVILASVVGAFVFGLVDIGESPPNASFTFSQNIDEFSTDATAGTTDSAMKIVRVTHNSGEAISVDQLVTKVSGNKSEPQSNASVYAIDYNGDASPDDWDRVLNDSNGQTILKPGDSFTVEFYGVSESNIDGQEVSDYNITNAEPPTEQIAFTGTTPEGRKLNNCDTIEVVWRSASGARGQVLQTFQLPGLRCL